MCSKEKFGGPISIIGDHRYSGLGGEASPSHTRLKVNRKKRKNTGPQRAMAGVKRFSMGHHCPFTLPTNKIQNAALSNVTVRTYIGREVMMRLIGGGKGKPRLPFNKTVSAGVEMEKAIRETASGSPLKEQGREEKSVKFEKRRTFDKNETKGNQGAMAQQEWAWIAMSAKQRSARQIALGRGKEASQAQSRQSFKLTKGVFGRGNFLAELPKVANRRLE